MTQNAVSCSWIPFACAQACKFVTGPPRKALKATGSLCLPSFPRVLKACRSIPGDDSPEDPPEYIKRHRHLPLISPFREFPLRLKASPPLPDGKTFSSYCIPLSSWRLLCLRRRPVVTLSDPFNRRGLKRVLPSPVSSERIPGQGCCWERISACLLQGSMLRSQFDLDCAYEKPRSRYHEEPP